MFSFSPMDTATESETPASALLPTTASPSALSSFSTAGIKRKLDTAVSLPDDVLLSFDDKVDKMNDMGFNEEEAIVALLETMKTLNRPLNRYSCFSGLKWAAMKPSLTEMLPNHSTTFF